MSIDEKHFEEVPVSIRLNQEILDQADALIPLLKSRPEFKAFNKVSRHMVLKTALIMGLEQIRKTYDQKG